MVAEVVYKYHLVERVTGTGCPFPGSSAHPENILVLVRKESPLTLRGNERLENRFHFQVTFSWHTLVEKINRVTDTGNFWKAFGVGLPHSVLLHVNPGIPRLYCKAFGTSVLLPSTPPQSKATFTAPHISVILNLLSWTSMHTMYVHPLSSFWLPYIFVSLFHFAD